MKLLNPLKTSIFIRSNLTDCWNYFGKYFPQIALVFVLFFNLQCALCFLISPSYYATAFELYGIPGDTAVQGFGLLFVMWSIPYVFALSNPLKHRISYLQAVMMQATGLIGEIIITETIPEIHTILLTSLQRFIVFDALGLILLVIGFITLIKSPN
jgi:hypothetical protein